MDYSSFDTRKYPVVPVKEGYQEWSENYDESVYPEMDINLLAQVTSVNWSTIRKAVDFACGTGRIGGWLKHRGVGEVDGVDMTPEMLVKAKEKNVYSLLITADVLQAPLVPNEYELCVQVLADEHFQDIRALYAKAASVIKENGYFVIVGFHPFFLMNGIITHFHKKDGEPIAIESYVHLFSDHIKAAYQCNFSLLEMNERIVDDGWLAVKPKWIKYKNHPVSYLFVWQKSTT